MTGRILADQSGEQTVVNSSAKIHKLQIYTKRKTVHRIMSANMWRRKVKIMKICETDS